jgi:hypothetical protein
MGRFIVKLLEVCSLAEAQVMRMDKVGNTVRQETLTLGAHVDGR